VIDVGIFSALIGLLGIFVGAILQSILSDYLSKRQNLRTERLNSYQAFWAALSRDFTAERFEWQNVTKDKEFRAACLAVGIYGSRRVIKAIAALVEGSGVKGAAFDQLRLYEVIREMRRDLSGYSDRHAKVDLFIVLSAGTLETYFDKEKAIAADREALK